MPRGGCGNREPPRHHMLSADIDEIIAIVRRSPSIAALAVARCCAADRGLPVSACARLSLRLGVEEYRSGTLAGEPMSQGLRESERFDLSLFSPATRPSPATTRTSHGAKWRDGARDGDELERAQPARVRRGRRSPPRGDHHRGHEIRVRPRPGGTVADRRSATPDSSRFWPADQYQPGTAQPSFDKQPLRDYLDGERRAGRGTGTRPTRRRQSSCDERPVPGCVSPNHWDSWTPERSHRELRP